MWTIPSASCSSAGPARRDAVCAAGREQFAGRADLYPSSPFFIEAVPLGVAKDSSLAALLERMGLTRDNLMACGDGLNDCSMIAYAGGGRGHAERRAAGQGRRRLCDRPPTTTTTRAEAIEKIHFTVRGQDTRNAAAQSGFI